MIFNSIEFYIDVNNPAKKHFTSDPLNFTDSSHLQFSATEKFNTLLVKRVKKDMELYFILEFYFH